MPNNDYIFRGDVLNAIRGTSRWCIDAVEKIPAVDAEPVRHGFWVYKMRERNKCETVTGFDAIGAVHTITVNKHVKGYVPYCGLCNALAADSFLDRCPRCGAKMDMEAKYE